MENYKCTITMNTDSTILINLILDTKKCALKTQDVLGVMFGSV